MFPNINREITGMETISRKEAYERGLTKYFTGKPCVNGHTVQRYVTSGACSSCAREAQARQLRKYNLELGGLVEVTVRVPRDAVDTIREVERMLLAARPANPVPTGPLPPLEVQPMPEFKP